MTISLAPPLIPGLLDQVQPESSQFLNLLLNKVQEFGLNFFRSATADERWSLADCGLTESDWAKIRRWASECTRRSCPSPNSRAAGLLLILISTAVARSLEKDEALWHVVAESCSDDLRRELFANGNYPVGVARDSLAEACRSLSMRHHLDLPDKHIYWRTVQLQFGFSGKVGAARLPFWLAGYSVPETIRSLLTDNDENFSQSFQRLWTSLASWSRQPNEKGVEQQLLSNLWYPAASHALLKSGIVAGRDQCNRSAFRVEDEDAVPSLFGIARYRDSAFMVGLSSFLPKEIRNSPTPVLRLQLPGIGTSSLLRDKDGGRELSGGLLRIGTWDALQNPTPEVRVIGPTGTIFKERLALWSEDEDVVVFRGEGGRKIRDLARMTPERGIPYSVVVRSDVRIRSSAGEIHCHDQSDHWSLYLFPQGLPSGLEATIDGSPIWSPGNVPIREESLTGTGFYLQDVSPISAQLSVRVPAGWAVEGFRFNGVRYTGDRAKIDISPAINYNGKKARVVVTCREDRRTLVLEADTMGSKAAGAAFEDSEGHWRLLNSGKPVDSGKIEGRVLAVRWNSDGVIDAWLTLGCQPLLANPHSTRRQQLIASGEPLELRFGLMNEERQNRLTLAAAVYATGLLAEVRQTEDLYLLKLKEPLEAATDFRVWVWEEGQPLPRLLPKEEVEVHSDNETISILQLSAAGPLGWAVSLDGDWRGGRFHVDPESKEWPWLSAKWNEVLAGEDDLQNRLAALRWWRFPFLMWPFEKTLREKAARFPFQILRAWTESAWLESGMALTQSDAEFIINPLRTFLWNYIPTTEECDQLWEAQKSEVASSIEKAQLPPQAALLLISHPVLLARILCEVLWSEHQKADAQVPIISRGNLFRREPDPQKIKENENNFRSAFRIASNFIERHAAAYCDSSSGVSEFQALRDAALSELKSWADSLPLDDRYFQENIVSAAEALFENHEHDTKRLKVAVTRSRACCAFLVLYMLKIKGIRD